MSDHIFYCPKCGDVTIEFDENEHSCITCKNTQMINTGKDSKYFRDKYFAGKEMCDELLFKYNTAEEVRKEFFYGNSVYNVKAIKKREELRQRVIAKNLKETGSIQTDNIPKCPTCGSADIEKISGTNKVASAAMFGVFSLGHISKTFKCKNCGMKF